MDFLIEAQALIIEAIGFLAVGVMMLWRIARTTARFESKLEDIGEDIADLKKEAAVNHVEHREMREMLATNAERIARIEGKLGD